MWPWPLLLTAHARPIMLQVVRQICLPLRNGKLTKAQAVDRMKKMGIDSCPKSPGVDLGIFNYM
jgi:hypothetical protein